MPAEYNTVRKVAIDLVNDLLGDKYCDAIQLQSPHRSLLQEEEYQPGKNTLVQAYQLEVDTKAKEDSMDGFIDDIITITIDDPNLVKRTKKLSLIGHPHHIQITTVIRTAETGLTSFI